MGLAMMEMWDKLWGEEDIKFPATGLILAHVEATVSVTEFRLFTAFGEVSSVSKRTTTPAGVLYVR